MSEAIAPIQSELRFQRTFAAAHRLMNHPGKCRNIHGHNYHVEVVIAGPVDETGMVVEFDHVKKIIDAFDHTLILYSGDPLVGVLAATDAHPQLKIVPRHPTTENLSHELARLIYYVTCNANNKFARTGVVAVTLSETDNITSVAIYSGSGD